MDICKAFSVFGAGLGGLPITLPQPSVPTGSSPCKLGCMEHFMKSRPGMSSLAVLDRDLGSLGEWLGEHTPLTALEHSRKLGLNCLFPSHFASRHPPPLPQHTFY